MTQHVYFYYLPWTAQLAGLTATATSQSCSKTPVSTRLYSKHSAAFKLVEAAVET
jgi:hypothetical protein